MTVIDRKAINAIKKNINANIEFFSKKEAAATNDREFAQALSSIMLSVGINLCDFVFDHDCEIDPETLLNITFSTTLAAFQKMQAEKAAEGKVN